jgi:hypothetical protein
MKIGICEKAAKRRELEKDLKGENFVNCSVLCKHLVQCTVKVVI